MAETKKFIDADEYYERSLVRQREIIQQKIDETIDTGDMVILLPFDAYPIIKKEMKESGWGYATYRDSIQKKCTAFYPKYVEAAE